MTETFKDMLNNIDVKEANLTVAKDGKEVSVKVQPEGQKDEQSRADDSVPFQG
jgi:hypothetical protein